MSGCSLTVTMCVTRQVLSGTSGHVGGTSGARRGTVMSMCAIELCVSPNTQPPTQTQGKHKSLPSYAKKLFVFQPFHLSPGCRVCRVCRVLSGPVGELSESCRAVVLSGLSGSVVSCRMSCRVLSGFSDSDHACPLSGPVGSCRTVILSYCRTVGAVRQLSGNCRVTVGLCEAIIREVCEAGDKSRRN